MATVRAERFTAIGPHGLHRPAGAGVPRVADPRSFAQLPRVGQS